VEYLDHPHPLATAPDALRFMLAGNAYFTVRSKRTDTRYTFRINRADCMECGEECTCGRPARWFVSLLSGPDNSSDYVYIGMIQNEQFKLTRASKMTGDSMPVRAIRWVLTQLSAKHAIPTELEIWHEGRCGRCGRRLTVPESISLGIGPDCAQKMGLQLVMFGRNAA
jgi:hypothetical protein